MAEEVKDETVNEESSNSESETKDETLESAGEVVTSPTNETSDVNDKYIQLEQRITSLEQRFNAQEQQQQQQQQEPISNQDNGDNGDNDDNGDNGDNGDNMESNDEIKKILGL